MTCHNCAAECIKYGRNPSGTQRFHCCRCRKVFSEPRRAVGNMYLPFDKANLVAHLLVEGNSIRSTSRIAGVNKKTVLKLLVHLGEGCAALLRQRVRNLRVSHLELDEIWTYVRKKQERVRPGEDSRKIGDAYCFIALDRKSRLIVAWHLGKRTDSNTQYFITKVRDATAGTYQISTDGWPAYPWAIAIGLHDRASHGRLVKILGPGRAEAGFGQPDLDLTETTYVERFNGTLRQWSKRYTRLTYAFSKKWEMLEHALALQFAHYNFCRIHDTLKVTPAMEAGVASEPWQIDELLEAVR